MAASPTPRRRWVREAHHRVAIADPGPAQEELNDARQRLLLAGASGRQDLKPLEAAAKKAAAKVEKCFATITFRQLPADEYEALVSAHPAQAEGESWNERTFLPALCAASCTGSDLHAEKVDKPFSELTEDEWSAELGAWALGDRVELLNTVVLEANTRRLSEAVPKG